MVLGQKRIQSMDNIEKGGNDGNEEKIVERKQGFYVRVKDEKTGIESIGSSPSGYDNAFDFAVEKLKNLCGNMEVSNIEKINLKFWARTIFPRLNFFHFCPCK